jgi:hypothetical protein
MIAPAWTLKFNAVSGQSFMFFLQVKAAGILFKVLGYLRRLRQFFIPTVCYCKNVSKFNATKTNKKNA